jgi:uncharacterized cupin superfamily protein
MKKFKKLKLETFRTRGFNLTPLELKVVVPFDVKRVYYFDDLKPEDKTGAHCHKIEEEFFVQAKGTSTAVIDQGKGIEDIAMQAGDAIYCPNFVWHGFKDASSDAVILALSSTNYQADRSDYIEDYDEFVRLRGKHLK